MSLSYSVILLVVFLLAIYEITDGLKPQGINQGQEEV